MQNCVCSTLPDVWALFVSLSALFGVSVESFTPVGTTALVPRDGQSVARLRSYRSPGCSDSSLLLCIAGFGASSSVSGSLGGGLASLELSPHLSGNLLQFACCSCIFINYAWSFGSSSHLHRWPVVAFPSK